ncbi:MTH938/NDUFAF3 family protein [candidate division KSB1 bacterium]
MYKIDTYNFGKMVVNGQVFTNDLIILPDRVIGNWRRKQGHNLHTDDLKEAFEAKPDILVIGKGTVGMMQIPDPTRRALETAGIKIHEAKTGRAVELFNELSRQYPTTGAFHLTC